MEETYESLAHEAIDISDDALQAYFNTQCDPGCMPKQITMKYLAYRAEHWRRNKLHKEWEECKPSAGGW